MPASTHHRLKDRSLLFYALLGLIFLSPIPYGSSREWAEALLLLITAGLSVLTVLAIVSEKIFLPQHFRRSVIFQSLFAAIVSWQILQITIQSPVDINRQLTGLFLTLFYWLIFNLTLIHCNSFNRLNLLLWSIVLSGLFQAFYGSMMVLTGIEWLVFDFKEGGQGVATGTFVNRNHLAGYLELSLACGLGLLIAQLKDIHFANHRERLQHYLQTLLSTKVILRLILCIMVIALVMTRSRMGNMAFFSSLFICGAVHLFLCKKFTRSAVMLFASLLLIDTLIVSQWFGLKELAERLNVTLENIHIEQVDAPQLTDESSPGNQATTDYSDNKYKLVTGDSRDQAWDRSVILWQENPFWGNGYGSFYTSFPHVRDASIRGYFDFVHNDYLQFLIEFGLPGTLLFALLALLTLYNAIRTQLDRSNKTAISAAFAAMMGICSIAIHSWTDFNLYIPANAMLVCILIAASIPARWLKS